MQRSSEFPLFFQSGVAIVTFLMIVALVSWMTPSQANLHGSATPTIEVAQK